MEEVGVVSESDGCVFTCPYEGVRLFFEKTLTWIDNFRVITGIITHWPKMPPKMPSKLLSKMSPKMPPPVGSPQSLKLAEKWLGVNWRSGQPKSSRWRWSFPHFRTTPNHRLLLYFFDCLLLLLQEEGATGKIQKLEFVKTLLSDCHCSTIGPSSCPCSASPSLSTGLGDSWKLRFRKNLENAWKADTLH